MKLKKYLIGFIVVVMLSCSAENEISLKSHYDIVPGANDGKVYTLIDGQYEENSDGRLENLLDWFVLSTITDERVTDRFFSDIDFIDESRGKAFVINSSNEYKFTYILLEEIIYLEFDSIDYSMEFEVKASGKSIESCKPLSVWFDTDFYKDILYIDEFNCKNGDINSDYNIINNYISEGKDTIAIFSIVHRPK